jgi:hypothetical protein
MSRNARPIQRTSPVQHGNHSLTLQIKKPVSGRQGLAAGGRSLIWTTPSGCGANEVVQDDPFADALDVVGQNE